MPVGIVPDIGKLIILSQRFLLIYLSIIGGSFNSQQVEITQTKTIHSIILKNQLQRQYKIYQLLQKFRKLQKRNINLHLKIRSKPLINQNIILIYGIFPLIFDIKNNIQTMLICFEQQSIQGLRRKSNQCLQKVVLAVQLMEWWRAAIKTSKLVWLLIFSKILLMVGSRKLFFQAVFNQIKCFIVKTKVHKDCQVFDNFFAQDQIRIEKDVASHLNIFLIFSMLLTRMKQAKFLKFIHPHNFGANYREKNMSRKRKMMVTNEDQNFVKYIPSSQEENKFQQNPLYRDKKEMKVIKIQSNKKSSIQVDKNTTWFSILMELNSILPSIQRQVIIKI